MDHRVDISLYLMDIIALRYPKIVDMFDTIDFKTKFNPFHRDTIRFSYQIFLVLGYLHEFK